MHQNCSNSADATEGRNVLEAWSFPRFRTFFPVITSPSTTHPAPYNLESRNEILATEEGGKALKQ